MGDALSHGIDRMKAENPLNRQADIAAAMERTPSDLSFMKCGKHQTAQDIFLASSIGLTEPLEELNRPRPVGRPQGHPGAL
jgi:putative heme degradation protein